MAKGRMNGRVKVARAALIAAETHDFFPFLIEAFAYASRARKTLSFKSGSRSSCIICALRLRGEAEGDGMTMTTGEAGTGVVAAAA